MTANLNPASNTVSIRVPTPDGTAFVHIIEYAMGKPAHVIVNIGKAGVSVAAWAEAVARLCTMLLERGVSLNELIDELSAITSERVKIMADNSKIRSGPEGIAVALIKYRHGKFRELKNALGTKAS